MAAKERAGVNLLQKISISLQNQYKQEEDVYK